MTTQGRPGSTDVALMAAYLAAGLPLQLWSSLAAPLPLLNYGPPLLPGFLAYAVSAPYVAYLLWRRSPRARLAAYVFLTFDILRSARLVHWLPLALDLAIILYLQTSRMQRIYPSMWSRARAALDRGRHGQARRWR